MITHAFPYQELRPWPASCVHTHQQTMDHTTDSVETSLSGFDVTTSHVHKREYHLHTLKLQPLKPLNHALCSCSWQLHTQRSWLRVCSGCMLMLFTPMYKDGCDVKSRERCFYYYYDSCTLLLMYSWCTLYI
jgi:hypothetical protein